MRKQTRRELKQKSNNPRFILRNYIAQNAISAAEKGDFTEVRRVLKLLENPYSDTTDTELTQQSNRESDFQEASEASCSAEEYFSYDSKPPGWATDLRVT